MGRDKRSAHKLATRDHAQVFVADVRGNRMIKFSELWGDLSEPV